MFCDNCGNELREGARFCPKCGAQIKPSSNQKNGTDCLKEDQPMFPNEQPEPSQNTDDKEELNKPTIKSDIKKNTAVKILVPIAAVLVAAGIVISVLLIVNNNKTSNLPVEAVTTQNTTVAADEKQKSKSAIVPDTVGMEYEKALSLLMTAGFKVKSSEEYSDDVEYGHVISQSLAPGTHANKASSITLFVSKGKETNSDKSFDGSSKNTNSEISVEGDMDYNNGVPYSENIASDIANDNENTENDNSTDENSLSNSNSNNDNNSLNEEPRGENSNDGARADNASPT